MKTPFLVVLEGTIVFSTLKLCIVHTQRSIVPNFFLQKLPSEVQPLVAPTTTHVPNHTMERNALSPPPSVPVLSPMQYIPANNPTGALLPPAEPVPAGMAADGGSTAAGAVFQRDEDPTADANAAEHDVTAAEAPVEPPQLTPDAPEAGNVAEAAGGEQPGASGRAAPGPRCGTGARVASEPATSRLRC